ncbi:MAG TPA: Rne/Rng family ribonuclease [Bacillota bacterium]|nr:Rne/Rng family ribonuclease [Bacillota bacterium]HOL10434.1 Rne/Rng family ribonuclease [Bacillota bacterium]HPO98372.1 Rne/Rng family ribonuclease [Bacillota bacterium]
MVKQILINIGINETRVAILEDDELVEFAVEYPDEQRRAGNIYRGKVENVLPGMQAAFINIGEEKNAFIYIDDVLPKDTESESSEHPKNVSITDLLHEGEELIVQMIKEPIGTKGARVVTQITIPGRYLVLIPTVDYIGISRKIQNEAERERLKEIVSKFKSAGVGLIVRTVAEDVDASELQNDYEFLISVWKKILKKAKKGPCPSLLYRDHDLLYRILRDYLSKDVTSILIDDSEAYYKALELVKSLAPSFKNRVQFYQGEQPLFEVYNVENQLAKALKRKVWLECGAYLIFDQTEALTVIDVNTGKFTGTTSLEDTVFQTNLMAATEIARQIRLRNLAGIIVIDFIDMISDEERAKVIERLEEEFKRDKIKVNILGFTSLGLLELTRKKVRQSLREILQTECEHCDGTGYVSSLDYLAHRALRAIQQLARNISDESILLAVNPQIASLLIGPSGANLEKIENNLNKTLFIKGQENLDLYQTRLLASGTKKEIEALALPVREGQELELKVSEAHIANSGDGIARIEGYVVDVEGGALLVGKTIKVLITKTFKTYAKARIVTAV